MTTGKWTRLAAAAAVLGVVPMWGCSSEPAPPPTEAKEAQDAIDEGGGAAVSVELPDDAAGEADAGDSGKDATSPDDAAADQ